MLPVRAALELSPHRLPATLAQSPFNPDVRHIQSEVSGSPPFWWRRPRRLRLRPLGYGWTTSQPRRATRMR
eukprot:12888053-Prorocentrum_lima.AAC.1